MHAFSRARGVLAVVTALFGGITAVLLAALARRTPGAVELNALVQLVMSVFVPFIGVLTVQRAGDRSVPTALGGIARSLLSAGGFALYGVAVSAVAAASTGAGSDVGVLGQLVVASVAVQGLAQLIGTGSGLLVRRPVLACVLTIVVPLGVAVTLTSIDPSGSLRARATPFGGAIALLNLTPHAWPGWLAIAGGWGLALNAVAVLASGRHHLGSPKGAA